MKCVFLVQVCMLMQTEVWGFLLRGRENSRIFGKRAINSPQIQQEGVSEKWFTQTLDHFNPNDNRTWQQRYFVNSNFFDNNTGKVAFLQISGEGPASLDLMTEGDWIDKAQIFGAICFQIEHRYYGESIPTADLSVENLEYLTSQQAIADADAFISQMKTTLPPDVQWVAFGASYAGNLAAWLREKYPASVQAAVSSSAPVLAKFDFKECLEVVDASLATFSSACVNETQEAFDQLYTLLNDTNGQEVLNEKLRLCTPIQESNDPKNVSNLLATLTNNFATTVQFSNDNRFGISQAIKDINIDALCDIMTNETLGDSIDRLAAVNNLLLNSNGETCTDYSYIESINALRMTSNDIDIGRQWFYQTCREFAFFQTSHYMPQVFGHSFPLSWYVEQCEEIFGSRFNRSFIENAVEETNAFYGGLNINVSNVVFVQGSLDPWHPLGITKTLNPSAPAIFIEGTAHCADVCPPLDSDLPALTAARLEIQEYLQSWLNL